MKSENIIISEGERPIWQMVIAAFFYTLSFGSLSYWFFILKFKAFDLGIVDVTGWVIAFSVLFLSVGIKFSVINNVLFNLDFNTYKDEYAVGPIKYGKWQALPDVKYVSVFDQPLKEGNYIFEVNLWYEKNKHFNIYRNSHYEPALEMGFHIANKLNVKLLDATVPNNFKYLDMDELKEIYKE